MSCACYCKTTATGFDCKLPTESTILTCPFIAGSGPTVTVSIPIVEEGATVTGIEVPPMVALTFVAKRSPVAWMANVVDPGVTVTGFGEDVETL
jgi:hypothetical protein